MKAHMYEVPVAASITDERHGEFETEYRVLVPEKCVFGFVRYQSTLSLYSEDEEFLKQQLEFAMERKKVVQESGVTEETATYVQFNETTYQTPFHPELPGSFREGAYIKELDLDENVILGMMDLGNQYLEAKRRFDSRATDLVELVMDKPDS